MIEDELLAAIVQAPDDDAPRLVFADWLSERGDPRGEQIAVEVAPRVLQVGFASVFCSHGVSSEI